MKDEKTYVIRKYVKAPSVKEAIEREANAPIADVFVDESSKDSPKADAIGFKMVDPDFPYEYYQ
jgi:hypothetical protein